MAAAAALGFREGRGSPGRALYSLGEPRGARALESDDGGRIRVMRARGWGRHCIVDRWGRGGSDCERELVGGARRSAARARGCGMGRGPRGQLHARGGELGQLLRVAGPERNGADPNKRKNLFLFILKRV